MTKDLAPSRRRCRRLVIVQLLIVAGLVAIAHVPVTTKQGIDFQVSEHRLPLYRKAFEFLDRDAQYRFVAESVTASATSDSERIQAVFDWTVRRIQPQPEGWTVVDDHILNIIIRGYGTEDQRADVAATLTTYAGIRSFWRKVRSPGSAEGLILTFALVDGRWVVMDVANRLLFRTHDRELATLDDLSAGRAVLPPEVETIMIGTTSYPVALRQLQMPAVPDTLRAELQMPWPRLWYQTRRVTGQVREDEDNGFER